MASFTLSPRVLRVCFFFNDTATTEIYTLSLHDALPIYENRPAGAGKWRLDAAAVRWHDQTRAGRGGLRPNPSLTVGALIGAAPVSRRCSSGARFLVPRAPQPKRLLSGNPSATR